MAQKRNLILTNLRIYLTKKTDIRFEVPINDMSYIVKSLNGNEFILAFYKEKDARIRLDDRDNFLNMVKAQYCS